MKLLWVQTMFWSLWISRACLSSLSLPSLSFLHHSLCSSSRRTDNDREGSSVWDSMGTDRSSVWHVFTLLLMDQTRHWLPPHPVSQRLSSSLSANSSCRRDNSALSPALSSCQPINSSDSIVSHRLWKIKTFIEMIKGLMKHWLQGTTLEIGHYIKNLIWLWKCQWLDGRGWNKIYHKHNFFWWDWQDNHLLYLE